MAVGDLTTLANAKAWLGLTDTSQDAIVSNLITAISSAILNFTGRTILTPVTALGEVRDGKNTNALFTREYPIDSLTSLYIDGALIPQSTGYSPSYTGGAGWLINSEANAIKLIGYKFTKGVGNVTINYQAGYATVPSDMEMATWIAIKAAFDQRRVADNLNSESIPGVWSGSYVPSASRTMLPKQVMDALRSYVRITF
jgi:hypothetical protein